MRPSAGSGRDRGLRGSLLGVMLAGALTLSACGGEKSDSAGDPTSTPATPAEPSTSAAGTPSDSSSALPSWPDCSEVWVANSPFPQPYVGCLDGDTAVGAEKMQCSSGQVLVTYADRFYAVEGEHVNETEVLSEDAAYRSALTACLA